MSLNKMNQSNEMSFKCYETNHSSAEKSDMNPKDIACSDRIRIDGIPDGYSQRLLYKLFQPFATKGIPKAFIFESKKLNMKWGVIQYRSCFDAFTAMKAINGTVVEDNQLYVHFDHPMHNQSECDIRSKLMARMEDQKRDNFPDIFGHKSDENIESHVRQNTEESVSYQTDIKIKVETNSFGESSASNLIDIDNNDSIVCSNQIYEEMDNNNIEQIGSAARDLSSHNEIKILKHEFAEALDPRKAEIARINREQSRGREQDWALARMPGTVGRFGSVGLSDAAVSRNSDVVFRVVVNPYSALKQLNSITIPYGNSVTFLDCTEQHMPIVVPYANKTTWLSHFHRTVSETYITPPVVDKPLSIVSMYMKVTHLRDIPGTELTELPLTAGGFYTVMPTEEALQLRAPFMVTLEPDHKEIKATDQFVRASRHNRTSYVTSLAFKTSNPALYTP